MYVTVCVNEACPCQALIAHCEPCLRKSIGLLTARRMTDDSTSTVLTIGTPDAIIKQPFCRPARIIQKEVRT